MGWPVNTARRRYKKKSFPEETLFLTGLEFVAHTDLPAFDGIVVVVYVDIGAAVHNVGIPVIRNVVADTDGIRIGIIADADRGKALPTGCQGDLAAQADLVAIVMVVAV